MANNYKTRLGCGVQCIPEPGQPVVYHASQNPVSLLCTMWLIITKLGWAVVYNVTQNPVSLLYTTWLIITTLSRAVVYNVSQNPVSLLCQCIPKPSQPVVYHMLYLVQFNVCLNPVFLYSTSSHLILGPPVQHRHFNQSFALVWYGYFTTLDQSYSKAKINYYVCHLKEGRGRIDMKQKRQGRRRKECA